MRQMASQYDSVKRENIALASNIDIFRKSEEQLRIENSNLKDLINGIETERIHFRALSEQLQREIAFSRRENAVNYSPSQFRSMDYNRPSLGDSVYHAPTIEDYSTPRSKPDMQSYQRQYMPPTTEMQYQRYPDSQEFDEQNSSNFQEMMATQMLLQLRQGSNHGSAHNTPSRRGNESDKVPIQSMINKKMPQKLPMHLASSISFEYPDQFDQYYRKNMSEKTVGGHNLPADGSDPVNPNLREDAQKAYFQSHLENVFDWNQEAAGIMGQRPQGSQQTMPIMPREAPSPSPPVQMAPQLNTLQKHELIKKLENSLLTFQMEKDRLQLEFEKIPESHRKSHNQLDRKQELENEIKLNDKNINMIKLKLKSLHTQD